MGYVILGIGIVSIIISILFFVAYLRVIKKDSKKIKETLIDEYR